MTTGDACQGGNRREGAGELGGDGSLRTAEPGQQRCQVLIPGLLHDKWEPRLLICSLQNREITLDFWGGPQATGVLRRGREAEASQRGR